MFFFFCKLFHHISVSNRRKPYEATFLRNIVHSMRICNITLCEYMHSICGYKMISCLQSSLRNSLATYREESEPTHFTKHINW